MTYSIDFRIKVLEIKEKEGLSFAQVAKKFHIGIASVVRWKSNLEPVRKRNKAATKINMEALKEDIQTYPDAYQYERAERFGVTQTGIWHALKRLGITYKKNISSSKSRSRKKICILPNNQ